MSNFRITRDTDGVDRLYGIKYEFFTKIYIDKEIIVYLQSPDERHRDILADVLKDCLGAKATIIAIDDKIDNSET